MDEKYGRLKIVGYDKKRSDDYNSSHTTDKQYYFFCRCECGNLKSVTYKHLKDGTTVSCGCYRDEIRSTRDHHIPLKHGLYQTRVYRIWCKMKSRCYDPNSNSYEDYGGRGISVCDEWKNDFIPFYEWAMANGYSDDLSINRIDVNGNYCPENCRWATDEMQAKNTRRNVYITYTQDFRSIGKGIVYDTFVLNDWAKILNVGAATLNRYLFKERGDMKINEVLDLCNIIGHGGGGQHPIVISQDMLEKRLPDKLEESLRDEIPEDSTSVVHRSKNGMIQIERVVQSSKSKQGHVGEIYGMLKVIGSDGLRLEGPRQTPRYYVKCLCECGNIGIFRYDHLVSGNTTSCGCVQKQKLRDLNIKRNTTHGEYGTSLHNLWASTKATINQTGLPMDKGWYDDYTKFAKWCRENGYVDNKSFLIRRVNSLGFVPDNCYFGDYHMIQITREDAKLLSVKTEAQTYTFTLADWSKILGLNHTSILYRLKKGSTVLNALFLTLEKLESLEIPEDYLKYNQPWRYEESLHD